VTTERASDWLTPQEVGNLVGGFSAQFIRNEIKAGELQARYVRSRSGKMGYYRVRLADARVPAETLGALPIDQLSEVQAWSKDGMQNPDRREELLESLPKGLGRPCVVAGVVTSEAEPGDTFLTCKRCDGRVASKPTGSSEELPTWPAGTLYGTNCPGKDHGHRYPTKGKKKNTRKAKA